MTGLLQVEATASDAGGELIVWTPTSEESHNVVLEGLTGLVSIDIPGGRLLYATVEAAGVYTLRVESIETAGD